MTKAQQVYERVEALVASGTRKADAFRQVAEEFDQPFNSMRGAYYAHSRTLEGGTQSKGRTRKRETTTADAVDNATKALRRAIDAIDEEVLAAKVRAEEAAAEHQALAATAEERKQAIETKIAALED